MWFIDTVSGHLIIVLITCMQVVKMANVIKLRNNEPSKLMRRITKYCVIENLNLTFITIYVVTWTHFFKIF